MRKLQWAHVEGVLGLLPVVRQKAEEVMPATAHAHFLESQLEKAAAESRRAFEMETKPFMPHLSLFYGNMSPEEKQDVIAQTGKILEFSFRVDKMFLMKTEGSVDQWLDLGEIPLGTS